MTNLLLIGQAEEIDLVQPQVRQMLAKPGIYIAGDATNAELTVVLASQNGRVMSMMLDGELDPASFLPTLTLHGPYTTEGRPRANLEGLRDALLAPREIVRDTGGWLTHPAFPVCDEDVPMDTFLAALGIESAFVSMEDDDPAAYERASESDDFVCSEWAPTPPAGDGWMLLNIFDTENGPHALFARRKPGETNRERRAREAAESQAAVDAAKATRLQAIVNEVHAWAVCAAIASPEDMAQNFPRIVEITGPAFKDGAVDEPRVPHGWCPIGTAPRDGTNVLLARWDAECGFYEAAFGRFGESRWQTAQGHFDQATHWLPGAAGAPVPPTQPDFAAVADKRMSELTPAQRGDAHELWIREQLDWFSEHSKRHLEFLLKRLDAARAADAPVTVSLSPGARDCLLDVVSHYGDFMKACSLRKSTCEARGDRNDALYWQHQLDVLARMKEQAVAALDAYPGKPALNEQGATQ